MPPTDGLLVLSERDHKYCETLLADIEALPKDAWESEGPVRFVKKDTGKRYFDPVMGMDVAKQVKAKTFFLGKIEKQYDSKNQLSLVVLKTEGESLAGKIPLRPFTYTTVAPGTNIMSGPTMIVFLPEKL